MQGLDNPFQAARYHSLVIDKDSCPDDLEVTAWTEDGIIMGVQHRQHAHIQVTRTYSLSAPVHSVPLLCSLSEALTWHGLKACSKPYSCRRLSLMRPQLPELNYSLYEGSDLSKLHDQTAPDQCLFLQGVQFHPESVITDRGKTIVQNFIDALDS